MHIDDIELAEPFESLFPRRADVEKDLTDHMADHGYLKAFPLVVWDGILVDGYHRYAAAKTNRIHDIPCAEEEFDSQDEAMLFCIRANAKRRHLTDAELTKVIREVDRINKAAAEERQREGQDKGREAQKNGRATHVAEPSKPDRSADQTAADVGVSRRKVEEVRAIEEHGTPEDIQEIEQGKTTIHKKAEEVKARRRSPEKPMAQKAEEARGPITDHFKETFNAFFDALKDARLDHWKTTSKQNASISIAKLQALVD